MLVFTSLWLIHIRLSNALNAPGYGNNFRQGGGPNPTAYRRAHYHHNKPGLGGQFKKKWYPPLQPGLNQRPRRPGPPPGPPPSNYMRQRLGLGAGPPQPQPPVQLPNVNEFKYQKDLQQEMQNQHIQQQIQHQQNLLNKNFANKVPHKWNNFPSRNLKPQPQVHQQQKPFLSSPKIQTELEYHIQTNQIPNQPVMIKQLDDEKGPIHTIPAPNLSLADKPKQVHIHQPHQSKPPPPHHQQLLQPHFESTTLRVLKPQPTLVHQYQVTESPDHGDKLLHQDIPTEIPPLKPEVPHSTDDVFGLLPVQDGYAYSVLHQPQLQQHMLQQQQSNAYQTMLVQPQFFQPDPAFLESQAQHKQMTPPEMHTFNYVEPKHDGTRVSHVSAEYILQADVDESQESGYSRERQHGGDDNLGGELINESFYSSLPSKDAAESFAQLHESGRRPTVNDQTSGQSKQKEMMIYVPDEQEQFDPAEDLEQYEANEGSEGQGDKNSKRYGFGSRIRPKKS